MDPRGSPPILRANCALRLSLGLTLCGPLGIYSQSPAQPLTPEAGKSLAMS